MNNKKAVILYANEGEEYRIHYTDSFAAEIIFNVWKETGELKLPSPIIFSSEDNQHVTLNPEKVRIYHLVDEHKRTKRSETP